MEVTVTIEVPSVGIVGLGLIGGSLARALRDAGGRVVATTRSTEAQEGARTLGVEVVDDVAALVSSGVEVVVAATALAHLPTTILEIGAATAGRGPAAPTVTDVGSVKAPIAAVGADLPDPSILVPGHPMAGTERSGWEAGSGTLFEGRTWALALDPPVDLGRWADVARVALAVGATIVPVSAAEHDRTVALVSHLPYALAAVGAGLVDDHAEPALARALAAGSFRDLTRVAGGHPTLGAEMASGNADALAPVLRTVGRRLVALAEALDAGDDEVVAALFAAGRRAREHHDATARDRRTTGTATLDREGLLGLGRIGGRISEIRRVGPDGVDATFSTPARVAGAAP
ncbi:prephenate dehydrogenase/arogenate dehydrogenase family protein [Iamia sp. SCSIO 61187]|uniref:prephenate dehydrogenase n=1 Tax=Iamia sp. SCSIO 61187 TaxID=2722752 RepID=UPI001C633F91|nr:prephenate dehydrogenase/arogenate dehydrogenase family protein [Iamia sp. SCSIO 61187]QYG92681.1 prephenate dehydrogenase/arogenate dehydrogenase family protein [Iamia sp. SCSIO 61187]